MSPVEPVEPTPYDPADPDPVFATPEDVATRLGRDLFPQEEAGIVQQLCEGATALIAEAAGKDDAWSAALDPVPKIFNELAIQMVIRARDNPEGLDSSTESLGAYSKTERYADTNDLMLSDEESQLVRRVVFGRGSGSSTMAAFPDELPDWQNVAERVNPFPTDDELFNT